MNSRLHTMQRPCAPQLQRFAPPPPPPKQALSPGHFSAVVLTEKSVLCVNKQAVLIVTSAPVHSSQTLTGSLLQKARQIAGIFVCDESSTEYEDPPLINPLPSEPPTPPQAINTLRIQVRQSPYLSLSTTTTLSVSLLTAVQPATRFACLPSRRLVLRSERAHSLPIKLMVHPHWK